VSVRTVTLYGKPGCHLCDDARAAVAQARELVSFELEEIDVSLEPGLQRQYGERIPVVAIDGVEAFELGFDASRLVSALEAAPDRSLE